MLWLRRLVVVALLSVAWSCDDGTPTAAGEGTVRFLLTDSPFPFDAVKSVDVHIVSLSGSRSGDSSSLDPNDWDVVAEPDMTFDLLALQRGATALLAEAQLSAIEYQAVRLVIRTDLSSVTMANGSKAFVQWPTSGELALHALIEQPFALFDGRNGGSVVIDFDVGRSFLPTPNGFVFSPVIRAVNDAFVGSIEGSVVTMVGNVTVPAPDAVVTIHRGDPANPGTWYGLSTAVADNAGRFEAHFLSGALYIVQAHVRVNATTTLLGTTVVQVNPGEQASVTVVAGADAPQFPQLIEVTGASAIEVGEAVELQVTVWDGNGTALVAPQVEWVNGAPGVVALAGSGDRAIVKGLSQGHAPIFATSAGVTDSMTVVVGGPPLTVGSVEVNPMDSEVAVGQSGLLSALVRDPTGQLIFGRAVVWGISDSSIVVPMFSSPDSLVFSGGAVGNATVTATAGGLSTTAAVRVIQP